MTPWALANERGNFGEGGGGRGAATAEAAAVRSAVGSDEALEVLVLEASGAHPLVVEAWLREALGIDPAHDCGLQAGRRMRACRRA
jgi:hypothetical protein